MDLPLPVTPGVLQRQGQAWSPSGRAGEEGGPPTAQPLGTPALGFLALTPDLKCQPGLTGAGRPRRFPDLWVGPRTCVTQEVPRLGTWGPRQTTPLGLGGGGLMARGALERGDVENGGRERRWQWCLGTSQGETI